MTTEDDFHRALDANPGDWQTRLVFADWLQERGDVRADGYRALAARHFCPLRVTEGNKFAWTAGADDNTSHRDHPQHGRAMVTRDWFQYVTPPTPKVHDWSTGMWWAYFRTRAECEDALARAFDRLTAERRIELLAAPPFVPATKPAARKKPTRRKPRK